MQYDLLFKNGVKEKVIQDATEEQHKEVLQIIVDSFQNETAATITFGNGTGVGRYIRVSDLSQVQTEILSEE